MLVFLSSVNSETKLQPLQNCYQFVLSDLYAWKKCMLFQQNVWKKLNVGCCAGQMNCIFIVFILEAGKKAHTVLS